MASTIDNSNIIELNEKDVPGAALNKSPEASSVLELKRWLECHREKKSGKKDELVIRVKGCIQINKGVDPKVDGGKWHAMKEKNICCKYSFTEFDMHSNTRGGIRARIVWK